MGIVSGTLSYTRYFTEGELQGGESYILERLKLYRPQPLDPDSSQEEAFGWTSIEAILGDQLLPAHIFHHRWAIFALRIDRWKIPPTLLKAHIQLEVNRILSKTDRDSLSRSELKKIRQEVKNNLKKKTLPQISVYDICWDWRQNQIRIWSNSSRVNELFIELFEKTFPELRLVHHTPYTLAERLFPPEFCKELPNLKPANFFFSEDEGEEWTD